MNSNTPRRSFFTLRKSNSKFNIHDNLEHLGGPLSCSAGLCLGTGLSIQIRSSSLWCLEYFLWYSASPLTYLALFCSCLYDVNLFVILKYFFVKLNVIFGKLFYVISSIQFQCVAELLIAKKKLVQTKKNIDVLVKQTRCEMILKKTRNLS